MIQRIQTLYLLISELLVAILFFVPLAEIAGKEGSIFRFNLKGIYPEGVENPEIIYGSWPVMLMSILTLFLLFFVITQFKNRIRQMRLATVSIFLLIGLFGLIFFYAWKSAQIIDGAYSLTLYSAFPIIAAILVYLAIRAIGRDEFLVRSIDRIR